MAEYVFSQSEEYFSSDFYPTKEAAIAEGRAEYPGESFYVGEVRHLSKPIVNAEDIAEAIWNDAFSYVEQAFYDDIPPDCQGDYPYDSMPRGVRAETLKKIAEVINAAIPTPSFYAVRNVEEVKSE